MKKINNKQALEKERLRLQIELIAAEEALKDDLDWAREEVKPFGFLTKFFKGFQGKNADGLMERGIGFSIETILRSTLFAKSGWITKIIVPILIKNFSTGFVAGKKPEIYSLVRNLIQKARKNLKEDKEYYDKTTVDEMDY